MDIVVAIDRSPESRNALISALEIVESVGGRVIAVHVETGDESRRPATLLEDASERAEERGVIFERTVLSGDPIDVIPQYAADEGADAIYLGHRGLSHSGDEFSGESRGRLGSVAKGIVEKSAIPVTVFDRGL